MHVLAAAPAQLPSGLVDGFTAVLLNTVITYAVALVSSALILWFFGRFDGVTLYTMLAEAVALGPPDQASVVEEFVIVG